MFVHSMYMTTPVTDNQLVQLQNRHMPLLNSPSTLFTFVCSKVLVTTDVDISQKKKEQVVSVSEVKKVVVVVGAWSSSSGNDGLKNV